MSDLVGNPEDQFSHDRAHIYLLLESLQRAGFLMVELSVSIEILKFVMGIERSSGFTRW